MDYQRQHWIPKSYLKAWCDPEHRDRIVHLYGANGSYQGPRSWSKTFREDDLYTVGSAGERDLQTEERFKLIEDAYLGVMKTLEEDGAFSRDLKFMLAVFVAAMRNRSPRARDHWQRMMDRIVEVGSAMERDLARAKSVGRQYRVLASRIGRSSTASAVTLEEARAAAARPFGAWVLRHVLLEAQLLEKMSFVIMSAPPGPGFITSDSPVVWHDTAPTARRVRHLGLGHPFIEVSMPLSPRYCLVFDHTGKDGTCVVSQSTVDEFNSRTLHGCDTCFIAQSPDLAVEWRGVPTKL